MTESKVIFAEERKEQILKLLLENDKVLVPDLCEIYQVSSATIRKDLNDLEKSGKLIRTHGGAISTDAIGIELNTEEKRTKNTSNKSRIAAAALEFVSDGEIIILDAGTTTFQLAALLKSKRNLTIITNDMEIAMELENIPTITVILIGGMLRKGFHCSVGMFAHLLLQEIAVDKVFMAANSIDIETGVYTPDAYQADTKKHMMMCSREKILLADSTKIGRKSFTKFASLDEFDFLVTDAEVKDQDYEKMNKYVKVMKA